MPSRLTASKYLPVIVAFYHSSIVWLSSASTGISVGMQGRATLFIHTGTPVLLGSHSIIFHAQSSSMLNIEQSQQFRVQASNAYSCSVDGCTEVLSRHNFQWQPKVFSGDLHQNLYQTISESSVNSKHHLSSFKTPLFRAFMQSTRAVQLCSVCGHSCINPSQRVISDLLTHAPASAQDAAIVRAKVEQCKADLDAYDQEITRLEAVIGKLRIERRKLESTLNYIWNTAAAVCRLPVEILTQILIWIFRGRELTFPPRSVCTLWRRIIKSHSEMSVLEVAVTVANGENVEGVREFLRATDNSPLSLTMSPGCVFPRGADATSFACPVFDALVESPHCDRWKRLSIFMTSRSLSVFFRKEKHVTARFLESLQLDFTSVDGIETLQGEAVRLLITDAPRLRFLQLVYPPRPNTLSLPWHQLEEFDLSGCRVETTYLETISQESRTLRVWRLRRCFARELDNATQAVLPMLTTLSVSTSTTSTVLDSITTPSLTSLEVCEGNPLRLSAITDLLSRSSSVLTTLALMDVSATDDDDSVSFLYVLGQLSGLVCLRYRVGFAPSLLTADVFQQLASPSLNDQAIPLLLPKLRELDVTNPYFILAEVQALLAMVEYRWSILRGLRLGDGTMSRQLSVLRMGSSNIPRYVRERLGQFSDEGLNLFWARDLNQS
ncbi:hypothetical protein FISHEDRAFT_55538 [Fistulina hepatica ATCC 64428]|uniref:F-box domain-containing protein n=1 Tax=Fistulina hepatica ATCC 64428 TaxID=1128425 RepID=A0A0D7AQ16_9AGAR|nr:hypothetical protein FISHEDRAFT_55538 [Fistulina hepatica ATCC 64428]